MRSLRTVVLLSSMFLLAACGNSVAERTVERAMEQETGGNADVEMNADGTMKIENDEGSFSTGQSMPEGWPTDAPVFASAQVVYSGTSNPTTGSAGMAVVLSTTETAQTVTDFYKTDFKAKGWTITQTAQAAGTTMMVATKGTQTMSIAIGESDGQTTITMGIETGAE